MFTGIVEVVGQVKSAEPRGDCRSIAISLHLLNNDLKTGDSIAVNGVCLTVCRRIGDTIFADIGLETLKITTMGSLKEGDYVNVEQPLQINGRLGGHLVQGHIDGVGKVININEYDNGVEVMLEVPPALSKYIIKKGSVAINGVSLTVLGCGDNNFKVFLIPHTLQNTTFKYIKIGDAVNLEVDIIGKYVERLIHIDTDRPGGSSVITEEFLKRHGF